MKTIKFECPYCHAINTGDESLYGQRVHCRKCQAAILLPARLENPEPLRLVRLVQSKDSPVGGWTTFAEPEEETEIFRRSPAVRSFPGLILLGAETGGTAPDRIHEFTIAVPVAARMAPTKISVGPLLARQSNAPAARMAS